MAAYTSYDVVGKKEDISDIISNISPTKTPFQSSIKGEKIHNTLFQWQEDALAAVNLGNAQVDGFDATETAPIPTVMRSNYTQILSKTVKVAETTDAVQRYGRAKETAYQLAKFSAEVKRDLEAILTSGQASAVGNDTTARNLGSYQAQLNAANLVKTGATATYMTETLLLTTLQMLYTNGVDPDIIMMAPGDALNIAGFASAAGRYRTIPTENKGASETIVNAVDLYVSPYGQVRVVLNRFSNSTDTFIHDSSFWTLPTLRPWTRETLAKTGDATKMMIVGEFSLKHKNQLASAVVRRSA